MGCDIHLFVEAHKGKDEPWFLTNEYVSGEERDYALFTKIAGVRGVGPTPLGMPDDVSPGTQYHCDQWKADAHSHSWLPLKTFMQIQFDLKYDKIYIATLKMRKSYISEPEKTVIRHFDYGPNANIDWIDYSIYPIENYRVCFFFDN